MISNGDIVLRLLTAAALGSLIGLERERLLWTAVIRTHMLVCVGACLFMIVSAYGFHNATQMMSGAKCRPLSAELMPHAPECSSLQHRNSHPQWLFTTDPNGLLRRLDSLARHAAHDERSAHNAIRRVRGDADVPEGSVPLDGRQLGRRIGGSEARYIGRLFQVFIA